MKSKFAWQRRAALGGSAALGLYCFAADWLLQPLHVRGWLQPLLAQLNSLSWIASFPGYLFVAESGLREMLSPPHRPSAAQWWITWAINLVLWAVALRLLLRILFPVKSVAKGAPEVEEADGSRDGAGALPRRGDDAANHETLRSVHAAAAPEQLHDAATTPTATPSATTTTAQDRPPLTISLPPRPSRRTFLTTSARVAVATAAVAGGYSMVLETRWFEVTRRRHAIRGLHADLAGLRLVQLTDIHHGPAMSLGYVREIVAATNALKPDLILLTGDYVHRSPAYIDPILRELSELRATAGVVGVLGNHDWWESAPLSRECFAKAGIPLIDNDRLFLSRDRKLSDAAAGDGAGLCVAGVGDYIEDRIRFDRALRDVPPDMPRLLLSHNPDVAEYPALLANDTRIDLMIAGHTHGGQVRLPLLGTPMIPSRFGSKYASGLVQGPVCPVYISRGIGTTILPLRFGVRPEIAVTELESA